MKDRNVSKHGPIGPGFPWENVDKYAPLSPTEPPGIKPEELENKEVKVVLKQITKCSKKIKKILDETEPKTIAEELGLCIAELSLLYLRLNDLQRSGWNQVITYVPNKRKRDFLIVYIVTTPADRPKNNK